MGGVYHTVMSLVDSVDFIPWKKERHRNWFSCLSPPGWFGLLDKLGKSSVGLDGQKAGAFWCVTRQARGQGLWREELVAVVTTGDGPRALGAWGGESGEISVEWPACVVGHRTWEWVWGWDIVKKYSNTCLSPALVAVSQEKMWDVPAKGKHSWLPGPDSRPLLGEAWEMDSPSVCSWMHFSFLKSVRLLRVLVVACGI